MGVFREFRQFALRGSGVDIGVGVVLGAAFGGLIDSLVKDILLPPIGLFYSKINVHDLYINLDGGTFSSLEKAQEAGAVTVNYGLFVMAFIRFIIILFAVFVVVRQMNRWKSPSKRAIDSMTKKPCTYCCTSIPSKAVVCPNCGSDLSSKEFKTETRPKWKFK